MADALCAQVDPELFYPETGVISAPVRRICMACEVRTECLEYALTTPERQGVWGGLSENERRKLKRGRTEQRRAAA
ncbi:WhiB family transcriptional regulator [Streptomyces sp. ISL-98]|uniref:WhiB family transcriptional regulator n=1 Tax=Streptomyces sp. ISL-98 TaxID=2819192 RepID=UPI001BE62360|nr:WhiB family transcriptional regulator [Streptomyces sp. ISL-98]MBT2508857.1 WhiB family transcriptional regulator [Streptomyces sp. ISL-98]